MRDIPLIIIVDGDARLREHLAARLVENDYEPLVYASAEAFLLAGTGLEADCLLLDTELPGISGLELQRLLQLQQCAAPRLFLSTRTDRSACRWALRGGARVFLTKPVEPGFILEQIEAALWGRPSGSALFPWPVPRASSCPGRGKLNQAWRQ